jgi:Tol biopolymer transport system component
MRLAGLLVALVAALALSGAGGAGISIPPPPGDNLPTWSPDASVIVFASSRGGTTLRVTNPDGTGERQLPWLPGVGGYAFSPDWSHVAFQDEGRDMIVERLDGSDRVDLGLAAYDSHPSWSPDGKRVTYEVQPDAPSFPYVVVARIDGSEVRRLVRGLDPQWSPTGDRVAYLTGEPGDLQLHVIGTDGSGDVQPSVATGFYEPRWSPDGTRIALSRRGRVEVVDAATGRTVASASANGYAQFAWSPGGDSIAFATSAGLRILDVTSGRVHAVLAFGDQPAWSPDGRWLAFAAGGECRDRRGIYRTDVSRPRPVRITNDCRIVGTDGDDVLRGTELADVLVGLGGDDVLLAVPQVFSGDTLAGGTGNDALAGSDESDTLDGGPGNDLIRGGASFDLLTGGPGRDRLLGEGGRDLIQARDGEADEVSCGTNLAGTTGPEADAAYVDRLDRVAADCEYVYRPGAAQPVHGRTGLAIRVWPDGRREATTQSRVYALRCRPAGGTLPRPGLACARLARIQNPFAPVPRTAVCAALYGGDQLASVRGVYGGRPVRTTFSRVDACQIARWNRVAFLFPTRAG